MSDQQKVLDIGQAVVFLEKAVGEKGADFVYARNPVPEALDCVYFDGEQPSCIVGHVVSYMGYDRTQVREGIGAAGLIEVLGIEADAETKTLLNRVQELQDTGVPWGDAVEEAKRL
jgi:hypothetical protein